MLHRPVRAGKSIKYNPVDPGGRRRCIGPPNGSRFPSSSRLISHGMRIGINEPEGPWNRSLFSSLSVSPSFLPVGICWPNGGANVPDAAMGPALTAARTKMQTSDRSATKIKTGTPLFLIPVSHQIETKKFTAKTPRREGNAKKNTARILIHRFKKVFSWRSLGAFAVDFCLAVLDSNDRMSHQSRQGRASQIQREPMMSKTIISMQPWRRCILTAI